MMLIQFQWTPSSGDLSLLKKNEPFTLFKSFKFQVDSKSGHEISFWKVELCYQSKSYSVDRITIKLRLDDTATKNYIRTKFIITLKTRQDRSLGRVEAQHFFQKSSVVLCEHELLVRSGAFENSYDFPFAIECNISTNIENDTVDGVPGIISDFEKLLDDQKYSDFTVVTSTNKKFHVHKSILAARSEVFSAMFDSDMVENKRNSMTIEDFDDEVIQELLRYIYCGRIENIEELSSSLLKAADKYLLEGLKIMCLENMCEAVTFKNAIELLCLATNYKVDFLKSRLFNIVVYNIKYIDKSNLVHLDESVVREILLKTAEIHI